MGYILDEIMQAASTANAPIIVLPPDEAERLRSIVLAKFAGGDEPLFLWERFKDAASVRDPDAWRWIGDFIGNNEAIMFFSATEEPAMVRFERGAAVVEVLEESFGNEFFVTNPTVDYVLCHNHHDYLIAVGTARPWLLNRIQTAAN